MNCVRANICRSLPPQTEDYDPEEDEPVLEPSWPHLQVVYEFFLRFVVSSEVNAKVAKKYVDANFCYRLMLCLIKSNGGSLESQFSGSQFPNSCRPH